MPKHYHNQSCFSTKLVCGKTEHAHDSGCYKTGYRGEGNFGLKCGKNEHAHGENCLLQTTICGKGKYD